MSRPFVNELGEIREELGAERARQQMAEQRAAALEAELEAPTEARKLPETVEEEPQRAGPGLSHQALRSALQRPWWCRVFGS